MTRGSAMAIGLWVPAFALLVGGGGCADEAEPPPPAAPKEGLAAASHPGHETCDVDVPALLDLRPSRLVHACTCAGPSCALPELDALCAEDGDPGTPDFPELRCDPLLGFSCVAPVMSAQAGTCPEGYRSVPDVPGQPTTSCVQVAPRHCSETVACPSGSFCNVAAGSICDWECLPDAVIACPPEAPDCHCQPGSYCSCSGRCLENSVSIPPGPPGDPNLEISPVAATLSRVVVPEGNCVPGRIPTAEATAAFPLHVRLHKPAPGTPEPGTGETITVQVVASRGLRVHCGKSAPVVPNSVPPVADPGAYDQSCELTFNATHVHVGPHVSQRVWVRATDYCSSALDADAPWSVQASLGSHPWVQVVSAHVEAKNSEGQFGDPIEPGEYEGTAQLVGMGEGFVAELQESVRSAFPGGASRLVVPIRAGLRMHPEGGFDLALNDPTQVLAPSGGVTARLAVLTDSGTNEMPPAMSQPRWYLDNRTDPATWADTEAGAVMRTFGWTAIEGDSPLTNFTYDSRSGQLRGALDVSIVTGALSTAAWLRWELVLTRRSPTAATAVASSTLEPPDLSNRVLPWRAPLIAALAPGRFIGLPAAALAPIVAKWVSLAIDPFQSILPCLTLGGGTSLFDHVCDATFLSTALAAECKSHVIPVAPVFGEPAAFVSPLEARDAVIPCRLSPGSAPWGHPEFTCTDIVDAVPAERFNMYSTVVSSAPYEISGVAYGYLRVSSLPFPHADPGSQASIGPFDMPWRSHVRVACAERLLRYSPHASPNASVGAPAYLDLSPEMRKFESQGPAYWEYFAHCPLADPEACKYAGGQSKLGPASGALYHDVVKASSYDHDPVGTYTLIQDPHGFELPSIPFLTAHDRVAMGHASAAESPTTAELAQSCIDDLDRSPDEVASALLDYPSPLDLDTDLPAVLDRLFPQSKCINIAVWHRVLDVLEEVVPDNAAAGALYARLIATWLEIHSFLGSAASTSNTLSEILAAEGAPRPVTPAAAGDETPDNDLSSTIARMERGFGLVLHPRVHEVLSSLPLETVRDFDYRRHLYLKAELREAINRAPGRARTSGGLAVSLVESLTTYVKLVDRHLGKSALQAYAECAASGSSTRAEAALATYGRAQRLALLVEAMATALHAKATQGDPTQPLVWEAAWAAAASELGEASALLSKTGRALSDCENPLGIPDDALPLYFGDPSGTSGKAFSSSDYLLNTWAAPAVASAKVSLEAARSAWLQKLSSTVHEAQINQDRGRRVEELKRGIGTELSQMCGLTTDPVVLTDDLIAGRLDVRDCHRLSAAENTACGSVFDKLYKSTGLTPAPDECPEAPLADHGAELASHKLALCKLLVDRASAMQNGNHTSIYQGLNTVAGTAGAIESLTASIDEVVVGLSQETQSRWIAALDVVFYVGRGEVVSSAILCEEGVVTPSGTLLTFGACLLDRLPPRQELTASDRAAFEAFIGDETVPTLTRRDYATLAALRYVRDFMDTMSAGNPVQAELMTQGGDALPALQPSDVRLDALEFTDCGKTLKRAEWTFPATRLAQIHADYLVPVSFGAGLLNKFIAHSESCWEYSGCQGALDYLWNYAYHRVCNQYVQQHPLGPDLDENELVEANTVPPAAVAACYRGSLGEAEVRMLRAHADLQQARAAFSTSISRYDAAARSCIVTQNANAQVEDATDAHHAQMEELRTAKSALSTVSAFFGAFVGALSGNPSGILGGLGLGKQAISDSMDREKERYQALVQKIGNDAAVKKCWLEVTPLRSAIRIELAAARSAMLTAGDAIVGLSNLQKRADQLASSTPGLIAREEGRVVPSLAHHYWLDERIREFTRTMEWARRLTYLSLRSVEYEFQQTLPIRGDIIGTHHPDGLAEAIQRLQQDQATRTINGRRPEMRTSVYSLRDDLLLLQEAPPGMPGLPTETPTQRLRRAIGDPRFAYFDSSGTYLGQAVPFSLAPIAELTFRCAERLWSIATSIQGDLLGAKSVSVPLFVLKSNTFDSQWCAERGPANETRQVASVQPSVNLFKPGEGSQVQGEINAFTWAYTSSWINVKRKDFNAQAYTEGASGEFAGRGLYGEYILLFPWKGLLENGFELSRVEDVLLRFDYVSFDNGPTGHWLGE